VMMAPRPPTNETFSCIVANILAHVLIDMRFVLTKQLAPTGVLLLSGILTEQAAETQTAFDQAFHLLKQPFTFEKKQEGEWVLLFYQRILSPVIISGSLEDTNTLHIGHKS